jgi:hypothetical protein
MLAFHIRGAASRPLSTNPAYLKWLLNKDDSIRGQCLQGFGLNDVEQLADWLCTGAGGMDIERSAEIFLLLVYKARAISPSERMHYCRKGISALQHANVSSSSKKTCALLGMEVQLRQRAVLYTSGEEFDESIGWCMALLDDEAKMKQLAITTAGKAQQTIGMLLICTVPSKYCFSRSHSQCKRGAELYTRFSLSVMHKIEDQDDFMRLYRWSCVFQPFSYFSLCNAGS